MNTLTEPVRQARHKLKIIYSILYNYIEEKYKALIYIIVQYVFNLIRFYTSFKHFFLTALNT